VSFVVQVFEILIVRCRNSKNTFSSAGTSVRRAIRGDATVVVYPDAIWYGHVTEADVDEIIESHIVGGHPVERLRLADSCLNTETCEHRKPRS
jgi:(2Fe-2S) ferredoxin